MIKIGLFLTLILAGVYVFAQEDDRQRTVDQMAIDYFQSAGRQSALYYGKVQEGHFRVSNHPYLKDSQYAKSRLSYCQIIYPDALLRLDWSKDELIVQSPDLYNIVLFPENVDYADLHGRRIIYFNRDSMPGCLPTREKSQGLLNKQRREKLPGCPPTGYYVLLHSGKCKVLHKKTASLMLRGVNSKEQHYVFTSFHYLYKDGVYYPIRSKSGLLKHLHPYKKELKRYIKPYHLRFRNDAEEILAMIVKEYEKLSGL